MTQLRSRGPVDWMAFAEALLLWILLTVLVIGGLMAGCAEKRFGKLSSVTGITQAPPAELEKWVPKDLQPDDPSIHATRDSTLGPVLWLWPNGVANLVGVQHSVWCPRLVVGGTHYNVKSVYRGAYTGQLTDGVWGALVVTDWPDSLGVGSGWFTAALDADSVLHVSSAFVSGTPCDPAHPDTAWTFATLVREGR